MQTYINDRDVLAGKDKSDRIMHQISEWVTKSAELDTIRATLRVIYESPAYNNSGVKMTDDMTTLEMFNRILEGFRNNQD